MVRTGGCQWCKESQEIKLKKKKKEKNIIEIMRCKYGGNKKNVKRCIEFEIFGNRENKFETNNIGKMKWKEKKWMHQKESRKEKNIN